MSLSDQHKQYLLDHAVSEATIERTEIYSEGEVICFPWTDGHANRTIQRKRYVPGEKTGYLWEAGKPLHPWVLRELNDDGSLLIVEGTKQSLAAASWAPPEYSVYGMAGCRGFSKVDLSFAEDRPVFIILDADAASNHDVYDAGDKLRIRLMDEDAVVKFVRLPVEDKDGLDDYLAGIRPEKRMARLARRIAESSVKPADRKPTPKKVSQTSSQDANAPDTGGREMVAVNGDLKTVVDNIVAALKARWDGHYLFNYGRALTCVEGPSTLPLEDGDFLRLLADTVMMVVHHPATSRSPERFEPGGRPDNHTLKAVMASSRYFTELERVVRAPFVRPDGSICSTAGYDEATKTILIDDPLLSRLSVSDNPTDEERAAAVDLLMNEWLGDMPLPTEGDKANALAMLITPFVRGLFPLAPMAVINGLQMGVGKNLLADCLAMLTTGSWAVPMPYTRDDEETRKQITSAFRTGAELFAFDEAHVIEGASLARALTSITYTDRILGSSRMAEFPNAVTWLAMGNNVQVNGDVSRRVYWIDLKPKEANPQDRDASSFHHSDLRGWTEQNRHLLVSAVLILVRAWFAAGQPLSPRGTTLGSFEQWDKTVGGIVAHAGLSCFLGEIQEKRSETDFDGAYWLAHIQWLHETFEGEAFTTAEVRREAVGSLSFEAPPGMSDLSDKEYNRNLGKKYAQKNGRWFGNLRLVKTGIGHRSVVKWSVESANLEGWRDAEVSVPPNTYEGKIHTDSAHMSTGDVCVFTRIEQGPSTSLPSLHPSTVSAFDLETRSADELFTHSDFVRLGRVHGHPNTADPRELIDQLNRADVLTGHRALEYDLIALAFWHGADYEALAAKTRDSMIVARHLDPIGARNALPQVSLTLNAMAERHGVPTKTDDIKRLARKHGGFEHIPQDDPEYNSYLEGDVECSQGLYEATKEHYEDPYVQREHAVQTIMGRITLEGFRVDTELCWDRYQRGQDKLDGIRDRLHIVHGFPDKGSAPHRTTAGKKALYEALRASGLGPVWIDVNWPKNKDGSLAMGKEVLTHMIDVFGDQKPGAAAICRAILDMNGVRTIYGTVLSNLVGDRVHPTISPDQGSGRWSMKDPGLTVFGKRGGKFVEREVMLPDFDDHCVVCFDLDQVDMRCIAGLSQDREYMRLFSTINPETGKCDPHTDIARVIGLPREEAKAIGHGWNYGESINKMVAAGVRREAAEKFDAQMKENFPVLCEWRDNLRVQAGALGFDEIAPAGDTYRIIHNGYGRPMRAERARAYTQAPALMGQGTTRDIMAECLLRMPFEVRKMVRAVIHDEVVLSIPRDCVEDVRRAVLDAMTFEFRGVPITSGASKPGRSWGDCYFK